MNCVADVQYCVCTLLGRKLKHLAISRFVERLGYGLTTDVAACYSRQGKEILVFSAGSRWAAGFIQWVPVLTFLTEPSLTGASYNASF